MELQVQVQTLELRLSTVPHSESTRTNDVRNQLLGKQCALMQQLAEIDSQYSENTQAVTKREQDEQVNRDDLQVQRELWRATRAEQERQMRNDKLSSDQIAERERAAQLAAERWQQFATLGPGRPGVVKRP